MSDQLGSSRLQDLFEGALHDYEKKTDIALNKHPLAEESQNCDIIESVTTFLNRQIENFNEFQGKDKILKTLKNTLSALYKLSSAAKFGRDVGLVRRRPFNDSVFSEESPCVSLFDLETAEGPGSHIHR